MGKLFKYHISKPKIESLVQRAETDVVRKPKSNQDTYNKQIKEKVIEYLLEEQRFNNLVLTIYTDLTGDVDE